MGGGEGGGEIGVKRNGAKYCSKVKSGKEIGVRGRGELGGGKEWE
jgi:hypothetical protein